MIPNRLPSDAPILIVDDEYFVLWALQDALAQLGFEKVLTASNTQEGVSKIQEHAVQFAFLDVNLGLEKSFPLAEQLEDENVPYAFITGYDRSVLEGKFEHVPVLSKPLNHRALAETLRVAEP